MPTIGDIQQIYAAGFNLEDVKITLDHDLKMDVAGIKIDAREGEIISIPRWAALILENEKHCTIQETNMIVELKQALGEMWVKRIPPRETWRYCRSKGCNWKFGGSA